VLDAADLNPFWAAADETGTIIHIHPSYDAGDTRVNDYGLANAVGRISDAIVAVARLLASGDVTRYRNAKIFVPMGPPGFRSCSGAQAQPHDHAGNRRSSGRAGAAVYRQHPP
jgi:aminocarboxymuconate-semialdehyde decarboxylase